ncbi:MAG: hypothetical protein KGL74_09630, partial [Elusimicrobia bacterium]|nr:hypothetical protein [Elusimicrobiota bacterium]
MIRRGLITLFTFFFLFWLFWPRAWLPSGTDAITPLEILSPNSEMIADDGLSSPDDAVILLLAPDQEAFPGARVLRTAGVPYVTTRDLSAALTHRFVFLPSGEKTVRMSARDRARLGAFVAGGGTLVVQAAGPLQWPELTGLQSAAPSRRRRRLVFVEGSDSGFRNLTRPEQKEIRLASPSIGDGVWTSALIPRPGA